MKEGGGRLADMPEHRRPLLLASELEGLDRPEVSEGYHDGLANERCGDNRSRSYWHGWRNGMVDGGHAEKDAYQAMLAADVARQRRFAEIKRREPRS